MERRLQFAQQIVMLERRCREEDGVNRQPDEREASASEIRGSTSEHGPDEAGHYAGQSG
jgi:hypothetical protein